MTLTLLVCACGSREPVVGERVVSATSPGSMWKRCSALYPVVTAIERGRWREKVYKVHCPDKNSSVTVWDARVATTLERGLGRLALWLRILVWITVGIAILGLFVTDPFRLRRARQAVEKWREELRERGLGGGGDGLPSMAVLACEGCSAPLALSDSDAVECPHCHRVVAVPEDYREPARLRRRAMIARERAARLWRVYERASSPWLGRLLGAVKYAWLPIMIPVVGYGTVTRILRGPYVIFALLFILLGLLPVVARKLKIWPLPAELGADVPELVLPDDGPNQGPCQRCGAPVQVLSLAQAMVTCGYCGTDHLLARRIKRDRALALATADRASNSLFEATATLERAVTRLWRITYGTALVMVLSGVILTVTLLSGW